MSIASSSRDGGAPGELVPARKLFDLEPGREGADQSHQLGGERSVLSFDLIPEPFEFRDRLQAHQSIELFLHLGGADLDVARGIDEGRIRIVARGRDVVGLEDATLALFEHRDQGFDAGTEPADLRGIDLDRLGEFGFGQGAL